MYTCYFRRVANAATFRGLKEFRMVISNFVTILMIKTKFPSIHISKQSKSIYEAINSQPLGSIVFLRQITKLYAKPFCYIIMLIRLLFVRIDC